MFRLLFCILFLPSLIFSENRSSSAPFLSGDTFRALCDFVFDDTGSNFDSEDIYPGSLIFVKTDYLDSFFLEKHPLIKHPYILITHNSDYGIPGQFQSFLDDEKLLAWFGQNVECKCEKLIPIPIGLANRYWDHGSLDVIRRCISKKNVIPKDVLLYMNFTANTYPTLRNTLFYDFVNRPFCMNAPRKSFEEYLMDLARAKFVLSPRGNGLDCLRTWEALYMGAIPIVQTSPLDSLFEDLPVLIVSDWNEIDEDFLEQKWRKMQVKTYNMKKLNIKYWKKLIQSKRTNIRITHE